MALEFEGILFRKLLSGATTHKPIINLFFDVIFLMAQRNIAEKITKEKGKVNKHKCMINLLLIYTIKYANGFSH